MREGFALEWISRRKNGAKHPNCPVARAKHHVGWGGPDRGSLARQQRAGIGGGGLGARKKEGPAADLERHPGHRRERANAPQDAFRRPAEVDLGALRVRLGCPGGQALVLSRFVNDAALGEIRHHAAERRETGSIEGASELPGVATTDLQPARRQHLTVVVVLGEPMDADARLGVVGVDGPEERVGTAMTRQQ